MPSSQFSPIKSKRLDEKASLQSLNSRLEIYVMRVKEMEDAKTVAERELETIRDRMQQDMDVVRLRLTKELDDTRKKLDHELDQKTRLQILEQEQHVELVKLRAQVKELGDLKTLTEQLKSELSKERSNATAAKEELSRQTTELQAVRRRIKDLERERRGMDAALSDATTELEHLRKKSATFDLVRDTELSNIRKEMNAKHQEALANWKKDTEDRIHAVEKEVRNYFEGVVTTSKSQAEELSLELDSTKKELDRTANDYEESLQVRQSLADKVAQLERDYREERKKFKDDRKMYETMVEKLRYAKLSKEEEFNDLMDVKIALDAEITAYRRILDREETRVGLPTPKTTPMEKGKKRKSLAFSGNRKRVKQENDDPIRIAQLNLEKDFVVFENQGDKPVSLGNWEVRGKLETQVFRFPSNYVVKPHARVTVFSAKRNKNARADVKPDEDAFMTKKFSWNHSGDWAVLYDDEGVPVSSLAQGLPKEEVEALEAAIRTESPEDDFKEGSSDAYLLRCVMFAGKALYNDRMLSKLELWECEEAWKCMIPFGRDRWEEKRIDCAQLKRVLSPLDFPLPVDDVDRLFHSYAGESDAIGWYDFKQIYEIQSPARKTKLFQLALRNLSPKWTAFIKDENFIQRIRVWLYEMERDGFNLIGPEIQKYAIATNDTESELLIHQLKNFLQISDNITQ
uniref:Laminlike protein putative n=1 Tax=Albugo laibachii Nc14 TaxID=890382 RepID=F0WF76_9STRA|nr:laminlike protein putative [Albugo laibachii Nc14]|eukprot:CCA19858.1 laminlike protein putative [Albugo laibachii Nc14]